jgi:uncharacterized protein YuzE
MVAMRWEYDSDSGSLYVYFSDRPIAGQTEMSNGIIVDLDADSGIVGIEVISVGMPVNWAELKGQLGLGAEQLAYVAALNEVLRTVRRREAVTGGEAPDSFQQTGSFSRAELVTA